MRRTPHLLLFLALALGGCGGCEEDAAASEEGNGEGFAQRGSVGNAEKILARPRTPDGYEIIEAPRRPAREEREEHQNLVREPTSPDPHGGSFSLDEAVEGLGTDGTLVAELNTTLGTIFCDLYAEKVPNTVANFIGLARGKRRWWDARAAEWRRRPAYDGTTFHRVIPDYLIQGGDYLGDGSGTVGYTIPNEPHAELAHDREGLLCMATEGEDGNGAQFFITDGATPDLDEDDRFTIFGRCRNTDIVERIARVPQEGEENRPRTDVMIERVRVRRVRGG
ncbi:MAG TPA: peptidylprolyl isomerase, partial [Polyangiaceae bacterium LLY-WYZ-15_(1-7)]|nr:peptidylprolyl isomerase [Polyangiaceae bacterium LLY-WYZ-15_(1-7)]